MNYQQYQKNSAERINNLPMFFAFSDAQFAEGMAKIGLAKEDTKQIFSLGGGGYIKKTDSHLLEKVLEENEIDRKSVIADDKELLNAIVYELGNHEYCITGDPEPTCSALDISLDDERIARIFQEAKRLYWSTQE
jgi:hypothetical protein